MDPLPLNLIFHLNFLLLLHPQLLIMPITILPLLLHLLKKYHGLQCFLRLYQIHIFRLPKCLLLLFSYRYLIVFLIFYSIFMVLKLFMVFFLICFIIFLFQNLCLKSIFKRLPIYFLCLRL